MQNSLALASLNKTVLNYYKMTFMIQEYLKYTETLCKKVNYAETVFYAKNLQKDKRKIATYQH